MPGFLQKFSLDQLSFWIGFLTGIIFLWFVDRIRPRVDQQWARLRNFTAQTRQGISAGTEHRYRMDVLKYAQRAHLSSPLFSLDEILIEPHILAPPVLSAPGKDSQFSDIATTIIPYAPDWPELGSIYGSSTLTLAQALQGGANLVLLGNPGVGKTVALAHLASQLCRQAPQLGDLSNHIPLLVHVADLNLDTDESTKSIDTLINAATSRASTLSRPGLSSLLLQSFQEGNILLLLDGLDELPPKQVDQAVKFFHQLYQSHPNNRAVLAASFQYYDGLTKLGLIPVAMASWGRREREWFIQNWSDLWKRFVAVEEQVVPGGVDPQLLTGWLLQENISLTPLEFTLKVWAAFSGDVLGSGSKDAVEAYLRRIFASMSDVRSEMEELALSAVLSLQPVISTNRIDDTLFNADESGRSEDDQSHTSESVDYEPIRLPKGIADLVESGLLIAHPNACVTFNNPVVFGFLAARALHGAIDPLAKQPEWSGKITTLNFLIADRDALSIVTSYRRRETDPSWRGLLTLGHWLSAASRDAQWRTETMRALASMLQDEKLATGLRARALAALVSSNEPGIATLFRKLITSDDNSVRLLGVLGLGMCSDSVSSAVDELQTLLSDPIPMIRQAACLALVAIGTNSALEAVTSALLHGEEDVRRAASEALANHPEEGHPILKDGATIDDLLVRRAVVHGLVKVNAPWAVQILENMQIEDSQWVVRNAATQALEEISQANPILPRSRPPLSETPWLIAFAGEHGLGIAPGKPAINLLVRALQEGNQDQRIDALDRLGLLASPDTIPAIYHALFDGQREVREAAFNAIWHMAAAGVDLPPPAEINAVPQSNGQS